MKQGDVLGDRFELERRAGAGGMGEVFRARDRVTGEAVAVKVMLEDQSVAAGRRFAREARILSELEDPQIVRYVAHGVGPAGEPFLAMEWLEGEELPLRLARGALSVGETVKLGAKVAAALSAAHARGVVHRDLKPSNLFLVDGDLDRVKVLDFGIAWQGGLPRMTHTGAMVGTPGYMAPEQAQGGATIDARADVFALGCVLFECLTGKPAFCASHLLAVLAKVLFEEVPRLGEIVSGVPEDLESLIDRMLAKEPAARPRDGTAVASALNALGTPQDGASWKLSGTSSRRASTLMGAERRVLSVVLVGRTPMLDAGSAPTLARADVAETAEALRLMLEQHKGRLEPLADGSAVVTIFGAGHVASDQAVQAARCALRLRAMYQDHPMALATGWAQVRGRLPVGEAIDRAARLLLNVGPEGHGQPLLVVDEVTAGLLDARFEIVEGPAGLQLRGENELTEGARTLLGKATPCVGRDWELGTLEGAFQWCVEESTAQAVLVTAPVGMGKSRLGQEFVRRLHNREEEVTVWAGRIDSLRAGSALGLLGQVLRSALKVRDGEPLADRQQVITARVSQHVAEQDRRRVSEFLGEFVSTPFPEEGSAPLRAARQNAQIMSDQMQRAWMDFLRAESTARPVLIVLEDMHWGDLPSARFIDVALREVRNAPWMVVALARPEVHERHAKLWAERNVQEIRLKALSRKASERLVRQVLADSVGADEVERIVAQAHGHAFYLEELIRAVAENRGAVLPDTVLAMVEVRLSGLAPEARRVLRAASVFGEVCWQGAVVELLRDAMRPTDVEAWLRKLVESEVMVRRLDSRFKGESEFAFRHGLLREGAYASLTDEDRALGHRLAGEWLVQHGEGDALTLAEHFERGRAPSRAASFYLRAVEQAHLGGDTDAAIAHCNKALSACVPQELRIALLGRLCLAYLYRPGSLIQAETYVEEVLRLSAPGSTPWAQATSAKLVGAMHLEKREMFMSTLEAVKDVTPSPDACFPFLLALGNGSLILDQWGYLEAAERLLGRMHTLADAVAEREPIAAVFLNAIHAIRDAYANEDPWAGLQWARIGRARSKEINHPRSDRINQVYVGMNLWFLGAFTEAERMLRGVEEADQEIGTALRPVSLALLLADRGALEEAHGIADSLIRFAQRQRHRMDEGRGRWAIAEVLRRQGCTDAAEREALIALELLANVPLDQVAAVTTLAAILLQQMRTAEALVVVEDAMTKCAAMNACGLFRGAFLRLIHAQVLHATGAHENARTAILAARDRVLAIAAKIDEPEYRHSFLEDVPENARTLALAREWLDVEVTQ